LGKNALFTSWLWKTASAQLDPSTSSAAKCYLRRPRRPARQVSEQTVGVAARGFITMSRERQARKGFLSGERSCSFRTVRGNIVSLSLSVPYHPIVNLSILLINKPLVPGTHPQTPFRQRKAASRTSSRTPSPRNGRVRSTTRLAGTRNAPLASLRHTVVAVARVVFGLLDLEALYRPVNLSRNTCLLLWCVPRQAANLRRGAHLCLLLIMREPAPDLKP
jgi:hypothetical protein